MAPGTPRFAHLHNHTEFSALDAIQRLDSMCAAAVADGQDAIAITDHGTLAGTWKFARAARSAGIKPILGQEFYLAIGSRHERDFEVTAGHYEEGGKTRRNMHLTVLARNQTGWRNLLALNNASHDHYWYKPRIDLELLSRHSEGLILGSGCLGGPVASKLLDGDPRAAREAMGTLRDIADDDGLFAEVMDHGIDVERAIAPDLVGMAHDMGVPLVATNDAHYTCEADADAHDTWLAVGSNAALDDPDRFRFNGHGYHLRTAAEMEDVFAEHPAGLEAVHSTLWVAESIEDGILDDTSLKLPRFSLPNGHPGRDQWGEYPDEAAYMHHLVLRGAKERYGTPLPEEVKSRLRWEEDVISGAGTCGYFLIVKDMIDAARTAGYRSGFGRGSAGGSVTGYVLGIHGVDPIANGLLFERFLDPSRVGLPDIDSDFDEAGAAWVAAEYLPSRWGRDKVARIGSFGMSLSRKAIRDVARVSRQYDTGDSLARLVPVEGGKPASFDDLTDPTNPAGEPFRDLVESDPAARRVADVARAFEGVVAGESIHACGVLVTDRPLNELVPLRHERKKVGNKGVDTGVLVTQWDGPDVEQFGLLKLDDLAIRNLTIVSEALRLIRERNGEQIDVDHLDMHAKDPRTRAAWRLIGQGRTAGIFQLESAGMTRLCTQVQPASHDDLSAILALYRPGPMAEGMHERFADRKHGIEPVDYSIFTPIPTEQDVIASVLGDTYGLCVAEGERIYSASRGLTVPIEHIRVGELVQGVDDGGNHVVAPVTARANNGMKETVRVHFSSGGSVRVTPDHQLLTSSGWKEAQELTDEDAVAAPWRLLDGVDGAQRGPDGSEREKAAILGYLLGDGGLTSQTSTYFTNKDIDLCWTVQRLVGKAFPGTHISWFTRERSIHELKFTNPIRGGEGGSPEGDMLAWLRSLGVKTPRGIKPSGGCHSREKFIPSVYLSRTDESALALLGALWDCDGRVGTGNGGNRGTISFKTISANLADGVRHLLLRLDITSNLCRSEYKNPNGTIEIAHHIGVHQVERFVDLVVPYMRSTTKVSAASDITAPRHRRRGGSSVPHRDVVGIKQRVGTSWKRWCRDSGFGYTDTLRGSAWLGSQKVADLAAASGDAEMRRLAASQWQRVTAVTAAGSAQVYDLTVEGVHNFVAEGVVVHNCTFQEQLMRLSNVVAGFNPGERNRLRKAFSKKKQAEMDALRDQFVGNAQSEMTLEDGSTKIAFREETAVNLWRTFDASASYLFNACVSGDTVVMNGKGIAWTVEDLYHRLHGDDDAGDGLCPFCTERPRTASDSGKCNRCGSWMTMFRDPRRGLRLLALDSTDGRVRPQRVADVHRNGVKDVLSLRTSTGREVTVTYDHRMLTPDGYVESGRLHVGHELVTHAGYEAQHHDVSARTTVGARLCLPGSKPWLPGPRNSGFVDGGYVALKEWTEATVETAACNECGMTRQHGRLERAHLDGDRTNNSASNLTWKCVSHHKQWDYKHNNRRRQWGKGHLAGIDRIVAIEPAGARMTYDVEMAPGTDHNFIANGLVSHNSHSAAYAVLTFVTAYLKANWPAEYGAALLTSTGKEDKRVAFLSTLRQDGLTVLPPDVNAGGAGTLVDADGNIRLGLAEVKGAGKTTSAVVAEREAGGAFASLADLVGRVKVASNQPASESESVDSGDEQVCVGCLGVAGQASEVFQRCRCAQSRTEPGEGDELARTTENADGSTSVIKAVKHKEGYRLRRTVYRTRKDMDGNPVMATANLSLGVVEALIEAGACDQFGPRAGLFAACRALRDAPDLPIPDQEWGVVERSARQRQRLGVSVGEHPMTVLGPQVATWGAGDGRREARPRPVHRLADVPSGQFVVTAGVVAEWAERGYSRGRMAHLTLEGSKGVIHAVAWDETVASLKASGSTPNVGDVIAVTGRLQRRSAPKPSDNDADATGDDEAPPERLEMSVKVIWAGPLDVGERMTLPTAPQDEPDSVDPIDDTDATDGTDSAAVAVVPQEVDLDGRDHRVELMAGSPLSQADRRSLSRLVTGLPRQQLDEWLAVAPAGQPYPGSLRGDDGRRLVLVAVGRDERQAGQSSRAPDLTRSA